MNKVMEPSQVLIYKSDNGQVKLDVTLDNETVWLTQEQMAQLFGRSRSTINEHIKDIFHTNELVENQVMRKFGNSEFSNTGIV